MDRLKLTLPILMETTLRFAAFASSPPLIVHWREDPYRELVRPMPKTCLDELLIQWENEGARRMGGHPEGGHHA